MLYSALNAATLWGNGFFLLPYFIIGGGHPELRLRLHQVRWLRYFRCRRHACHSQGKRWHYSQP
jgi:hypothetical protein